MKKRILTIIGLVLLLGLIIVTARVNDSIQSRQAMPSALALLQSDTDVIVTESEWILLAPAQGQPKTGLILFPGGYVDVRAYAPVARLLAGRGYLIALIDPPLSTALLAVNEPARIAAAHPQIENWAVGGHSLGGVAAAQVAFENPELVSGVVLWAAAPASSNDLANSGLSLLAIFGSQDNIFPLRRLDPVRDLLPADHNIVEIIGANHAQFGRYGDGTQFRDGLPTISREEQEKQVADLTAGFLEALGTD